MTLSIDRGSHVPEDKTACVMEWVDLIFQGLVTRKRRRLVIDWSGAPRNAHPTCTNELITTVVISVNDTVSDEIRAQLATLIPRLLRARASSNRQQERRITRRLALRVAMKMQVEGHPSTPRMLEYLRETEDALVREGVSGARKLWQKWRDEETHRPIRDLNNAYLTARTLISRISECNSSGSAQTYSLINRMRMSGRLDDSEIIDFLSELLDLHDKIRADEGILLDPERNYIDDETLDELIRELATE